ncbi:GNAT family N-acetyltransferase [Brasilonema sp. UFV-L1]|uniref:GNAT family N-acetyltransferase n=2 Tax=Brasilonema sp. UFV-L1 TaxID=2234130 RepID=UPI00145D7488
MKLLFEHMRVPRTYRIHTERYILRCVCEQDIPYVFSATRFQGFNDGILWEAPKSIEELHEPLQRNLQAWDFGLAYTFTLESAETNAFIGRISIRKHNELKDVWNLGFWTHPEHQRQGYMTEAAKAIVEFGFTVLGAERIEAYHALWNKASEKVLKRIGMKFICYIPQGFQKHGKWVEENLLAIETKDWKSSKQIEG